MQIYLYKSFCYLIVPQAANKTRHPMINLIKRFAKDQSGAAAIEYGLIASGISVAIIPGVNNVGNKLVTVFTTIQNAL
jgi:pilus assembly protein Flp/PilA